jgi:hypothetical protein
MNLQHFSGAKAVITEDHQRMGWIQLRVDWNRFIPVDDRGTGHGYLRIPEIFLENLVDYYGSWGNDQATFAKHARRDWVLWEKARMDDADDDGRDCFHPV